MLYSDHVQTYEKLESTTGMIEKTEYVADLLKKTPTDLLDKTTLLLNGDIFHEWDEREIGIGDKILIEAVSESTGVKNSEIEDMRRDEGDIGNAIEKAVKSKKQASLMSEDLTIEKIYDRFEEMAEAEGSGSQETKKRYIADLILSAKPKEARYLARTVMGKMRTGVGEGILRDAISEVFDCDKDLVERNFMLTADMGLVAKKAKEMGNEGLREMKPRIGKPIKPMLAQVSESIEDVFEDLGDKARFDLKYDGARVQIHKEEDEVTIFSRRLEDVTNALPDVVNAVRNNFESDQAIFEGELVAISDEGPKPFQQILRRFRRKYNIDEMVEKIPLCLYAFDIVYEGEYIGDKILSNRIKHLKNNINPKEDKIEIVDSLVTSNPNDVNDFYHRSLEVGQEGLIAKDLNSPYHAGKRGKDWLKLKPEAETVDLVITGAEWGEGKRAHWLSTFNLGARLEGEREFVSVGKVGTGLTDEQFEKYTKRLEPLIEKEKGKKVDIKSEMVVEVAYQEIQSSPNYESGYALRFPRIIGVRDDKGLEDVDTIERIKKLKEKNNE